MIGEIIDVDLNQRQGVLVGQDGYRYSFGKGDWLGRSAPEVEEVIDFQPSGDRARKVHRVASAFSADRKSQVVTALLALFLGIFGAHLFYLRLPELGIFVLVSTLIGIALTSVLIGFLMLFINFLASIIWVLICIFQSDESFQRRWVTNNFSACRHNNWN